MKWVIIQTNLAVCPDNPEIEVYNAENMADLLEHMTEVERNDANITLCP